MGEENWEKFNVTPDCPHCQTDVFVEEIEDSDNIIKAGLYICCKCGTSFVDHEEAEGAVHGPGPVANPVPDTANRSDGVDVRPILGEVIEE
jgi:hypothetical protein